MSKTITVDDETLDYLVSKVLFYNHYPASTLVKDKPESVAIDLENIINRIGELIL